MPRFKTILNCSNIVCTINVGSLLFINNIDCLYSRLSVLDLPTKEF